MNGHHIYISRFIETEADCTLSLSLDPAYTKAYLRRGVARSNIGKIDSAKRGSLFHNGRIYIIFFLAKLCMFEITRIFLLMSCNWKDI